MLLRLAYLTLKRKLDRILRNQVHEHQHLIQLGARIMSEYEDLSKVVVELSGNMSTLADNVNKIPPAVDRLEAKISSLNVTPAQKQQLLADIGSLKTLSTAAANAAGVLAAAAADAADDVDEANVPPPPPPAPLATTFPSAAEFTAAASAYTGSEKVSLDGAAVATAGSNDGAALAYYSHSADGHIDTTGPTD